MFSRQDLGGLHLQTAADVGVRPEPVERRQENFVNHQWPLLLDESMIAQDGQKSAGLLAQPRCKTSFFLDTISNVLAVPHLQNLAVKAIFFCQIHTGNTTLKAPGAKYQQRKASSVLGKFRGFFTNPSFSNCRSPSGCFRSAACVTLALSGCLLHGSFQMPIHLLQCSVLRIFRVGASCNRQACPSFSPSPIPPFSSKQRQQRQPATRPLTNHQRRGVHLRIMPCKEQTKNTMNTLEPDYQLDFGRSSQSSLSIAIQCPMPRHLMIMLWPILSWKSLT